MHYRSMSSKCKPSCSPIAPQQQRHDMSNKPKRLVLAPNTEESMVYPFSEEEYRRGIATLNNNKAAGIDDVLVEQLKNLAPKTHKWMFVMLLHSEQKFPRLPPARGGTAQKKIIHLANWSQLIHPGPASSLTKVFLVSSKSCVNADSLLIRAAATSTSGTLNDLTTDLIMANNNNNNNNSEQDPNNIEVNRRSSPY